MSSMSVGDLAQSVFLRRQNAELKTALGQLTKELSSGKVADVSKKVSGDFSYVADVERGLRLNGAFQSSATEAELFAGAMQNSLARVSGSLGALTDALLAVGQTGLESTQAAVSRTARSQMEQIVSALNSDVAGRALFAGNETDGNALASVDIMLADLRTVLAGAMTLADVETLVSDWFEDPSGGFETLGYVGGTDDLSPFQLGDGERIDLSIRADAGAVRQTLKAAAMASLAKDSALAFSPEIERGMLETAASWALGAQQEVIGVSADLGYAEARIDDAKARLGAEESSLTLAQGELLGADPFETVTQLEEVQLRLESLYTATARLSQLSLMRFMQ